MKVLTVLKKALTDPDVSRNSIIYLYVYGGMTIDPVLQDEVLELIEQVGATVCFLLS